jgi:uncharacterized protein
MSPAAGEEGFSAERRDRQQNDRRIIGHVVQCDGSRAVIAAISDGSIDATGTHWTVGKLISINMHTSRIVGLVYEIGRSTFVWNEGENAIEVKVELVGEVRDDAAGGKPVFDRGITTYPHIGAIAHRIRARDLQSVYELAGRPTITLGSLTQDDAVAASVAVDDLLARHFAVVGTTGVGKSTAVSLILRRTIEAKPDLRILVLDPHNEFGQALGAHAVRIGAATLELPFWLFRLEEFCEVIFRGREIVTEELDLLRDLIPAAKHAYRAGSSGTLFRRATDALTADTPVPYRIVDLLKLLDERIGMLDSKPDRPFLRALKIRLESAISDPDYRFMFHSRAVEDTIHETIGAIFRIPHEGRPITCFEMAGMASEVVNAVCSVLARLAFDMTMWSEGRFKLLLLCEEAHRYLPANPALGFAPTRHALSRIAKEGRKYGCSLGVVTQRPGELDPTVLSQCSTVFAMRLANEQDQAIIRSAIADSSASTLSFLSAVGQREAIAFGEAVAATMRLRFEQVKPESLPGVQRSESEGGPVESADLELIVQRLRQTARAGEAAPGRPGDAAPADNAAREAPLVPVLTVGAIPAYRPQPGASAADFDTSFGLPRGGGAFGQRPRG